MVGVWEDGGASEGYVFSCVASLVKGHRFPFITRQEHPSSRISYGPSSILKDILPYI